MVWDLDSLLKTDELIDKSLEFSDEYYDTYTYFNHIESYLITIYHKSELYVRNMVFNLVDNYTFTTTHNCYNKTGLFAVHHDVKPHYYRMTEFIGSTDMIEFFYSGLYKKFIEDSPLWGYYFTFNSLGNIKKIDGDKLVTYYSFLNSPLVDYEGVTKEEVFNHLGLN